MKKIKIKPDTTKNKPKKPLYKHLLAIALWAAVLVAALVLILNLLVILSTEQSVYEPSSLPDESYDCIIVLGCGVKPDGTPTDMLYDRVLTAVNLYQSGVCDTLLMSGDHGREGYDEVNAMKALAIELGVPSEDIFMDHAGFSTYETMARADEIFGVSAAIVVTQGYHLPRALYLADSFGIHAVGVPADVRSYSGQEYRDIREMAARCKDVISSLVKPDFVHGDPIDIQANGDVTND